MDRDARCAAVRCGPGSGRERASGRGRADARAARRAGDRRRAGRRGPHENPLPSPRAPRRRARRRALAWVSGRVEFPPGTPRDERAFVVARGKKYGGSTAHRFAVGADGSFRAAFEAQTKQGSLDVVGRYVYLSEAAKLDPHAPPASLVLHPELGGCLRVRLAPSALALARAPDFSKARVNAYASSTDGSQPDRPGESTPDAQGVAELGGLAANTSWFVSAALDGFAARASGSASPKPGEVLEHEIALTVAPRVEGIVRDPRGQPVSGATLLLQVSRDDYTASSRRHATDDQGHFDLAADESGQLTVRAEQPGFVAAEAGPFEAVEGSEHLGLELRLADGLAIRGVVRWPDGSPAAEASVALHTAPSAFQPGGAKERSLRTDAAGAFEVTGLVAGEFTLSARARRDVPGVAKADRVWWTARREGVAAGTRDVALVLAAGAGVRGRVVDDLGRPIASFAVRAQPAGASKEGRKSVGDRFREESGAFELPAVPDGEWTLVAESTEKIESAPVVLVLPRDAGRAVDLVIPRPASISGRVVDVDGTPAASAEVELSQHVGEFQDTVRSATTDREGKFSLQSVPVGALSLVARRNDRASSIALEPAVQAGQELADVVLALRRGGTVEGRVLDATDGPRPDVDVHLYAMDGRGMRPARTAADGTFRIENVEPGKVFVSVQASDGQESGWIGADRPQKTVVVEEGRVVRVELGGATKGRILVSGTVRGAGPVAGATVRFFAMDGSQTDDGRGRTATTDESGRYELRVPGRGSYSVGAEARGSGAIWTRVDIGDEPTQTVDLQLGTARIAGRVLDPDGKPVARVRLNAQASGSPFDGNARSQGTDTTKSDGTFALVGLLPGTYTIDAEPDRWSDSASAQLSAGKVEGIELAAGANREGLEVRLERGSTVVVRVVGADGRPVRNANVEVATGSRMGYPTRSDDAGVARFEGVSAGPATITASTAAEVERDPVRLVVESGRSIETTITLVPGGRIALKLQKSDGTDLAEAFHYPIEILDGSGTPWRWSNAEDRQDGFVRFGPMRPGTYTVRTHFGKKRAESQVVVTAGGERDVVLREPDG